MSLQEKHRQFAVKSYTKNRTLCPSRNNHTKNNHTNNKPPRRGRSPVHIQGMYILGAGFPRPSCRSDHRPMSYGGIPMAFIPANAIRAFGVDL